ncbi:MAG: hypothetical protein ACRC2T_13215, partial [Thermoguttaceae bacterium]
MLHPLAGQTAPKELLIDVSKLENDYYNNRPDTSIAEQLVSFGTSGHRGKPADCSFTESHIMAIVQAVCDYRAKEGITGPLFLGMDTHAASAPAHRTALEVLAGNGVNTQYQDPAARKNGQFTPTPVISHAILNFNRGKTSGLSDGVIITPSHNPPTDGGIKYNPTNGGAADTSITSWMQKRANELLANGNRDVKRIPYEQALKCDCIHAVDFLVPYISELGDVVDLDAISQAGVKIGVDPLGGASYAYWIPIAEMYKLDITIVNDMLDPTFSFMSVDHDGKIRMDCSSQYAMRRLVGYKDSFDLAYANDPDADRHGIVTPTGGLMNPNHFLSVAISYLFQNRPNWPSGAAVGKTLVSSSIIDRVAASLGRKLYEVPVGFKW